jgi:two-component system alkaline phosphatase synthesis response regulator PhoP
VAKRILLVEDEKELLEIYEIKLNQAGFKTVKSSDGADAIVKIRNEDFALIISDLQMPKISGLKLIEEVRKRRSLVSRQTPIIIISGNIDKTVVEKFFKMGQIHFMCKPVSTAELIEKVTSIFAT